MVENIHWLGHDAFKITGSKVIYIDPYKIADTQAADIILITHAHYDHYSLDDIKKVMRKGTVVVGPADCLKGLTGQTKVIKPGDSMTVAGIEISAVPAYNITKKFHPKSAGWVGYVVKLDDVSIYHAGDTDFIPEMKTLTPDIALLPVSGTYVMTAEEAVEAAQALKAKMAIPMHYGSIVGSTTDAQRFKKALTGKIDVVLKEKE